MRKEELACPSAVAKAKLGTASDLIIHFFKLPVFNHMMNINEVKHDTCD